MKHWLLASIPPRNCVVQQFTVQLGNRSTCFGNRAALQTDRSAVVRHRVRNVLLGLQVLALHRVNVVCARLGANDVVVAATNVAKHKVLLLLAFDALQDLARWLSDD